MASVVFAVLYMIKGGWHWRIPYLKTLDHGVMGFFLDGTRLASILAALFIGAYQGPWIGAAFGLAWFVGTIPSMGEEAGAIGRLGHQWGPYIEKGFGSAYGWKKGLQRGVFMGAMLTLITGFAPFILAGALFPVLHFIGQELHYRIHKQDGWAYAEPLIGFAMGVAVQLYLQRDILWMN